MNIITINHECGTAEISLSVEEILVIFKACVNIHLGFTSDEYNIVYNVDETFIEKLIKDFDCFNDLLDMENNEILCFKLKKYDSKEKLIFIETGAFQIKSMRFALSQIPVNLYEEDCLIMWGDSWEGFLGVRSQILMLIRELNTIK